MKRKAHRAKDVNELGLVDGAVLRQGACQCEAHGKGGEKGGKKNGGGGEEEEDALRSCRTRRRLHDSASTIQHRTTKDREV